MNRRNPSESTREPFLFPYSLYDCLSPHLTRVRSIRLCPPTFVHTRLPSCDFLLYASVSVLSVHLFQSLFSRNTDTRHVDPTSHTFSAQRPAYSHAQTNLTHILQHSRQPLLRMLGPIVKNHRRLCGLTSAACRDLGSAFAQEGRSRSRFSLRPRCGHIRLETLPEDVAEKFV